MTLKELKAALKSLERISSSQEHGDHNLNPDLKPDAPYKESSVLILFVHCEEDQTLSILFTKRAKSLSNHPGQISFPGGCKDDIDKDMIETALRETEEETGLSKKDVTILGTMEKYITRTGFEVTPVIGLISGPVITTPEPNEVDEIFEVPLEYILKEKNLKIETLLYQGKDRQFYALSYNEQYIWGATAGMMKELVDVLNKPRK